MTVTHISHHVSGFVLDVWGGGVSLCLSRHGLAVHWQGDEAAEVYDRLMAAGFTAAAFETLWDEHEHVAEPHP